MEKTRVLKKGPGKATTVESPAQEHFRNLRCTHPGCIYLAKATDEMIAIGRLKCPVHPKTILKTREERGEPRGRYAA